MSIAPAPRNQVLEEAPVDDVEHIPRLLDLEDPPPAIIPPLEYIPAARSVDGRESLRAEWGSDSSPHQFQRRHHPRVDALAPLMEPRQIPLVDTPKADILRGTAGRNRPAAFDADDFRTAALTLVRYRMSTLSIIRQADRDARRMLL